MLGSKLDCNEAPDSRSLLGFLKEEKKEIKGPIVHHSTKHGVALRWHNYKWIPVTGELFNVVNDPAEKNNVAKKFPGMVEKMNTTLTEIYSSVQEREKRTDKGSLGPLVC